MLRQVAAQIDVDTALMSKLERGERRAQREPILKIVTALQAKEEDLTILGLADKINDVIQGEPLADQALKIINKTLKQ